MKKKFLGVLLLLIVLLTGCGSNSSSGVLKALNKKINKLNSYYLDGEMAIINNEDTYTYDVEVSYKKDDYFKVNLKNLTNNHEQVILKNKDGVFVVTPSLNKSFKFQSEWPYNNSQVYLLKSIIDDIKNDKDSTFEKKDGYYIFTSKVNYPNNRRLVKQVVYVDDKYNIKEVQVLDKDNNKQITMKYKEISYDKKMDVSEFNLEKNLDAMSNNDDTKTVSSINDVIYPMYLPVNTYLTSKDIVEGTAGERLILTFDGDSPFMVIEEVAHLSDEHTIIPTVGEPDMLIDTVGVVSENTINFVSNGIEYYVISDVINQDELLEVARSMSVIPVSIQK